ncbi:MAG: hypothetical protein RR022_02345 [Angelakisella sp.]
MSILVTPYSRAKSEAVPAKAAPTKAETAKVEQSLSGNQQDRVEFSTRGNEKLSAEQLRGIKETLSAQQTQLLQAMAGNAVNQANSALTALGKAGYKGLDSAKLPPLATTQEGAAAAIADGGAYSVDAVATRILDMAKSFAGSDPAVLEKMRNAVQKGFEAAGVDFKRATKSALPEISNRTYDEVMKRFDALAKELNGEPPSKPVPDKKA